MYCGAPMNAWCACKRDGWTWSGLSFESGQCLPPTEAGTGDGGNEAGTNDGGNEAGPDDSGNEAATLPDSSENNGDVFACCNANPDPCCPSKYCGAPVNMACACLLDGGTWSYGGAVDGGPLCTFSQEAGPRDGGGDSNP
jgi:hypothetical protein